MMTAKELREQLANVGDDVIIVLSLGAGLFLNREK